VAWRTSEKRWRFPVWQFGSDGRPLGGLSECIAATELDNEWTAMIFFLSPAESLDGLSECWNGVLPELYTILDKYEVALIG
jgi:hypothetical protein